jgi:hypothetical protein
VDLHFLRRPCGATSGVSTSNPSNVTCVDCQARIGQPPANLTAELASEVVVFTMHDGALQVVKS